MQALRFLNLGILAALIASSAVLYAQDEKQQEEKARQEEPKRQAEPKQQAEPNRQAEPSRQQEPGRQPEAKPESRQDEMKSPRQEEARPARPQQQEQKQGEMNRSQPETGRQDRGRQENRRQENGRQEAGKQQDGARAGGNSSRIPEDRFRAQFGREHHFAMRRPEVVEGRPRFEYGGYTFVLVDAWPPEWAYSDDCYIDYVDGDYFLFDLRHPEMRLALMLVM
jgi:hypothetical protein